MNFDTKEMATRVAAAIKARKADGEKSRKEKPTVVDLTKQASEQGSDTMGRIGQFFQNNPVLAPMLVGGGLGGLTGGVLSARSAEHPKETRSQRARRVLGDAMLTALMGAGAGGLGAYGLRQLDTAVPTEYQASTLQKALTGGTARGIYAGGLPIAASILARPGQRQDALVDLTLRAQEAAGKLQHQWKNNPVTQPWAEWMADIKGKLGESATVDGDLSRFTKRRTSALESLMKVDPNATGARMGSREALNTRLLQTMIDDMPTSQSKLSLFDRIANRFRSTPKTLQQALAEGRKSDLIRLAREAGVQLPATKGDRLARMAHPFFGRATATTGRRLLPIGNVYRNAALAGAGFFAPELVDILPGNLVNSGEFFNFGDQPATPAQ